MNDNKYNTIIYDDEPIDVKERIEKRFDSVPQRIKKARMLELNINMFDQPKERLFYLQGKLLEDYVDDFEYNCSVLHYFPTYQMLSDDELRGYFTWRTKIRKGIYNKTWLSYAFLYIYELLNQIGVTDPLDGFDKLIIFKNEYENIDNNISKYIDRWINDYIIYYGLDNSLLENKKEIKFDSYINSLINIDKDNIKENDLILESLNELSSYKLFNSPFYKSIVNDKDIKKLIIDIFNKISIYYENHHKFGLIHDYFGYHEDRPVVLFFNCIFLSNMNCGKREYVIDNIRKYHCDNGYWTQEGYSPYNLPSKKLGNLIKTIDSIMRERFKFNRTLKKGIDLKWVDKIINDEIDIYNKNKKEIKEITIDFSIINDIRKDSNNTKEKLIIEDEIEIEEKEEKIEKITNETCLNDDEYDLMKYVLYNKSEDLNIFEKSMMKKGIIMSVLVDSINDKLFDIFNDTVIEYNDEINIIEDYIDDLKGMIK